MQRLLKRSAAGSRYSRWRGRVCERLWHGLRFQSAQKLLVTTAHYQQVQSEAARCGGACSRCTHRAFLSTMQLLQCYRWQPLPSLASQLCSLSPNGADTFMNCTAGEIARCITDDCIHDGDGWVASVAKRCEGSVA